MVHRHYIHIKCLVKSVKNNILVGTALKVSFNLLFKNVFDGGNFFYEMLLDVEYVYVTGRQIIIYCGSWPDKVQCGQFCEIPHMQVLH